MKKKKILLIISSIAALLAISTWIYFKVWVPKYRAHVEHSKMTDMSNMDMGNMQDSYTKKNTSDLYICPMHPKLIHNKPGNCPICGMHLVKMESVAKEIQDTTALASLLLPTNRFAISAIPATALQKNNEKIEINALGYTAYNTTEVGSIASWINGRIEKLYIRYRYQLVKKGQKIMDIYSPDLLTAQQNLIFLLKTDPTNYNLINAAKERLLLLGFPEQQLQQVITTKTALLTVSVYSRYSGHIHEAFNMDNNNAIPVPEAPAMNEANSLTTQELSIKEGMYVQRGQTIFKVYNPNKIWALLNIYPSDQPFIQVGNKVRIVPESKSNKDFRGSIYFIEPFFRPGSKTITARVNVDNSTLQLPIGSQLRATIFSNSVEAEWLPKEAVLSLGLSKVVFVKKNNGYKAKKVSTGVSYKNLIQITGGITAKDSVAANAQFLMDSESFIKTRNNNSDKK